METVELRVHGVHGTSPGAMLGVADHDVGQVAGDSLTGIYRVKDGTLPHRDLEGTGISVEAYSWGALTSGVQGFLGWVKRALWLLLLPFALVNLAYWARLGLGDDSGQARWGARAVRVSGVLLTVFFVLAPCVLAIDLVAWQCYRYGVPGCSGIPDQLDFVAGWTAGQRMALATVIPMATVAVLWLLSRTSLNRYESADDPDDAPPVVASRPVLVHPRLWNGPERTLRLQRLHLAAATATVVAFSGIHLLVAADLEPAGWGLFVWATVLLAGALLLLTLTLTTVTHEHDVEPVVGGGIGRRLGDWVRSWPEHLGKELLLGALLLYVAHLVALATSHLAPGTTDESLNFVGRNVWFIVVFVGLTVLHVTVFVGGRMATVPAALVVLATLAGPAYLGWLHIQGDYETTDGLAVLLAAAGAIAFWLALAAWHYFRSPREHKDKAWLGAGASVLLAAASWIALLFTSGTVIASANYLNGADHGVGDLVSQIHAPLEAQSAKSGRPRLPAEYAPLTRFVASGEVVLRRARVLVEDGQVSVVSGTVEVDRLSSLSVKGRVQRRGPALEQVGTVRVRETSAVRLAPGRVRLEDSCLGESTVTCTAEDGRFRARSELSLASRSENFVELVVRKGVVLKPASAPEAALAVPQVLIWAPMGQLVWLILVIVAVLACLALFGRTAGRAMRTHYADPDHWLEPIAIRDRARARSARRGAALAHRSETLLDVVGAITSPVALVVVVASLTGGPPWQLPNVAWTRGFASASMWLVVGMSVGLIMLGSQIRRSEKTRKAVGVIWDLTTFWPRAAHPLAPPCYAERVVPELQIRTRWALDKPHAIPNQVILSGHSQGSLIVLATASRLSPEHLARVRIITYGSQIRALYGRIFPRVFGPDAIGYEPTTGQPSLLDAWPDVPRHIGTTPAVPGPPEPAQDTFRRRLADAGGEWVNLFRRTDPLGWRVFSDRDSDLDHPVPEVPPEGVGDPGPQVQGHSGYQHTRVYREQVKRWTGEPLVPDPPGTGKIPTLPPL